MTLQDFAEEIRKQVQEKMGTGYEVECQNMLENNGVRILKLSVTEIGSRVSFLITLNGYYENGDWSDMEAYSEDTAEEITRLYHEKNPVSTWAEKQTEVIKDFSAIRDKIMFRLIHTEMNRKQLETVPHIPFLDLSVVFYIPQEFDDGMCSLLIHNDLMDSWGVTVEQLYELALENTPNMLPIKMAELNMTEEGKMDLETKTDIENLKEGVLYHVSNPIGIFGAAVLMYPDFLQRCAQACGKNLVIIPGSVHEVLLATGGEHEDLEQLSELVKNINETELPRKEWLSDHAYLYEYKTGRLTAA